MTPGKSFERLLARIKSEYVEMPGLRLTTEQGSRLWGLDRRECGEVLDLLVERKFLAIGDDGTYSRVSDLSSRFKQVQASPDQPVNARFADKPANPRAAAPSGRR